jgi:hypothetical protein
MKASFGACLSAAVVSMFAIVSLARQPAMAAATSVEADTATSVRLSPSQFKLTIADIFGDSIKINGRFEPELREQGLLAIGARIENITDSGLESYDELARDIAAQVVDERHRDSNFGCSPRNPLARDDNCARSFFSRVGPLLYRRPLSSQEIDARVEAAAIATGSLHDFYAGVSLSLAEMLISPQFLFRIPQMESDPAHPGQERMSAYYKAAELSYFLWNTTPDEELLQAAKSGALNTSSGLERQVNRLMASPRVADSIRAFFSDMLGFSDFESVSKDPAFFPRYTPSIKEEAQEQTLRTIVDHVVARRSDYRDLFTTPHTYLTADLASLYVVPLVDTTDTSQPQRWVPYTYSAGDPRAGILSQASFTALWSPSGRTSPTVRGKALRQNILCERVPPPPGNVSFKFVDDTSNPEYKTTRERLTAHRTEPMCAGCHKLTDPLGLALENFDSAGEYRTTENGAPIDASGELSGRPFVGANGLAQAVHDDPAAVDCVARRAFAFETGYLPPAKDAEWQMIQQKFAANHYDLLGLMRLIALSDLSYSPRDPKVLTATNQK